jgi:hypothetical protein
MHSQELVTRLYGGNWDSSCSIAKQVVASECEAIEFVKNATNQEGWRERVAAAKVVSAFSLSSLVQPLVATFIKNPEFYTCLAFSKMVAQTLGSNGLPLLQEMTSVCEESDYGRNLKKVISDESHRISAA